MITLSNDIDWLKLAIWYNSDDYKKFSEYRFTTEVATRDSLKRAMKDDLICHGVWDNDEFVGLIRLHHYDKNHDRAEKHTIIAPAAWSSGYATKATKILFEKPPCRMVVSRIYEPHIAMRKVNEKVGMECAARLPVYYRFDGTAVAQLIYTRTW